MILRLDTSSIEDYALFLKIKSLPRYKIVGRTAEVPDEYASLLGLKPEAAKRVSYRPIKGLFDYPRAIAKITIQKRKFCLFIECGYGKTPIIFEHALAARKAIGPERNGLIVSPLNVIEQTIGESRKFYHDYPIDQVKAHELAEWMSKPNRNIGITNYEAITDDIPQGFLGLLSLDESSMLKSAYGKWGTRLLALGRGCEWKLAATGTPAPNDRIEFANHAVPIDSEAQVTRNEWIQWAECTWSDIKETDTLNVKEARDEKDVKHICPLQLGVINRLIRLYSNPGEIVFSPFAGIGSEGYEALRLGRRFVGIELKPEYHTIAVRNLERMKSQLASASQEMFPAFALD